MKGWAGEGWTDEGWWRAGWPDDKARVRTYSPNGTTWDTEDGPGRWRFVPGPNGLVGPRGAFLRHHPEGGRDLPTHFVQRWPRNWGWIVQNCWAFSTSFPLPAPGEEPELEDDGSICQSVTVETCADEAMRFNLGLPLPYERHRMESGSSCDSGDDEEGEEDLMAIRVNGRLVQAPVTSVAQFLSDNIFDDDSDYDSDHDGEGVENRRHRAAEDSQGASRSSGVSGRRPSGLQPAAGAEAAETDHGLRSVACIEVNGSEFVLPFERARLLLSSVSQRPWP